MGSWRGGGIGRLDRLLDFTAYLLFAAFSAARTRVRLYICFVMKADDNVYKKRFLLITS